MWNAPRSLSPSPTPSISPSPSASSFSVCLSPCWLRCTHPTPSLVCLSASARHTCLLPPRAAQSALVSRVSRLMARQTTINSPAPRRQPAKRAPTIPITHTNLVFLLSCLVSFRCFFFFFAQPISRTRCLCASMSLGCTSDNSSRLTTINQYQHANLCIGTPNTSCLTSRALLVVAWRATGDRSANPKLKLPNPTPPKSPQRPIKQNRQATTTELASFPDATARPRRTQLLCHGALQIAQPCRRFHLSRLVCNLARLPRRL